MRLSGKLLLASLGLSLCGAVYAADSKDTDVYSASLEDLLNMKVSVASAKQTSIKDSPGIITVITRDEITKMGARNLVDVLLTVPGFDFGMDTQGSIGLSVRGNWANEGKVLVMVDGQSYNETLYGAAEYLRFPVEQIEKIEIIRGPGSAMYGGDAELSVISITTRTAKSLHGGQVYGSYGQMTTGFGERKAGVSYGVTGGDWNLTALAFFGESQMSDKTYNDMSGGSYDMNGHSYRNERNLNIGFTKKDFSLRFIADSYATTESDEYGTVIPDATQVSFPSYFAEAKYEIKLSDSLKLVPRVNYAYTKPWLESDVTDHFDKTTQRYLGNFSAYYDLDSQTNFMGGAEFYRDSAYVNNAGTDSNSQYPDGSNSVSFDDHALFLQGTRSMDIFNVTAGARYEDSSKFGDSFVPRFALTKSFDAWRVKAMYSKSFRNPAIDNLRLNPDLMPEKTTTSEVEVGRQINKYLDLSVNAFQIDIKDPIVYGDLNGIENYYSYSRSGTRGAEVSCQFKKDHTSLRASYSYYAANDNQVGTYTVPQDSLSMMALARNKVAATATVDFADNWSLSPTAIFLADRNGENTNGDIVKYDDVFLANLYLLRKDVLVKGISLGVGVYNMFNTSYSYIQAYNADHMPLPAQSREFAVKASYEF